MLLSELQRGALFLRFSLFILPALPAMLESREDFFVADCDRLDLSEVLSHWLETRLNPDTT